MADDGGVTSVWRRGFADMRRRGRLIATKELFICDHASHPGCKDPDCEFAKPHEKNLFCPGDICDQCVEETDGYTALCFVKCVPYEEKLHGPTLGDHVQRTRRVGRTPAHLGASGLSYSNYTRTD